MVEETWSCGDVDDGVGNGVGEVSFMPVEVIKMLAAPIKFDSELTWITALTVLPRKLKTIRII